jgi:glycogen debranching enzyme
MARSEADLQMMTFDNPEDGYLYAGIPWFNTVFGRDGIITAMECLWTMPAMSKSVPGFLAETQASEVDDDIEAEPGKILHEMRRGEMANLKEILFGRYYGSVDATPLFVVLAGAYLDRSDDIAFIKTIWPNILAALDWMDKYGDADQDGFVEYRAKSSKGLVQQGWKDSYDSVFHRDGTLAEPPIALCEVQAYVFAALHGAARIAVRIGQLDLANKLSAKAEGIQEKFEHEFWDEDLNSYVLALDGQKVSQWLDLAAR